MRNLPGVAAHARLPVPTGHLHSRHARLWLAAVLAVVLDALRDLHHDLGLVLGGFDVDVCGDRFEGPVHDEYEAEAQGHVQDELYVIRKNSGQVGVRLDPMEEAGDACAVRLIHGAQLCGCTGTLVRECHLAV